MEDPAARERFVYTRDQLLELRTSHVPPEERPRVPPEIQKRTRGSRAGVRRREKKRRFKPSVPSIIMGNVRSLLPKADELAALVRTQRVYRESSVLVFTETWLTGLTEDSLVSLDGFHLVRADRTADTGKRRGGGVAVFVNTRWCHPGHVHVKEQQCTRDVELLAVSMRPYYIPRELSRYYYSSVYSPVGRCCSSLQRPAHRGVPAADSPPRLPLPYYRGL